MTDPLVAAQPGAAAADPQTGTSSPWLAARHRLLRARGFVFDMDGVLYRGGTALPGVVDLLNGLELRERRYMLATNNSMASPAEYRTKLKGMGIDVPEDAILTAGTATRDYLVEQLPAGAAVYVVGMPALVDQVFRDTGFRRVAASAKDEPGPIDAVVVGLDLTFTYDKLSVASGAIRRGARFVASNADATLPTEHGLVPGAGSIVAAVATAGGVQPTVIGKPSPRLLEQAAHRLGIPPAEAVMVGDRLDTDVAAGLAAGMLSVLVLTGVSTRDDVARSPILPDLVFTDLRALLEALVGNTSPVAEAPAATTRERSEP